MLTKHEENGWLYICYPGSARNNVPHMEYVQTSVSGLCKELSRYLCGESSRTGMRAVHRLRVDLKKARAVLWLSRRLAGNKLRLPPPVKAVFRSAGELRDIQLEMQWLNGLAQVREKPFQDILSQLIREERMLRARFRLARKSVDQKQWKRCCSDLVKAVGTLSEKKMKKFVNARWAVLVKKGRRISDRHALHGWRRKAKRIYLLADLASGADPSYPVNRSRETLHEVLQLAGEWHDISVAKQHVRRMRKRRAGRSRETIEQVEKVLFRTERQLLKKTMKGIAGLSGADLILT
jgi:hypothetical protein